MKPHIREVLSEKLTELRNTPFRTLINTDFDYVRGLLCGLMHSDAIDGDEFKRLNALALNAYQVRRRELFDLIVTRAAA